MKDEANKIISDMKEGKIKIDYETGKIAAKKDDAPDASILGSRVGEKGKAGDDEAVEREEKDKAKKKKVRR